RPSCAPRQSDTVNSDRGSDIDSLVASCCCLARFRCDRVPALIAASVASTGRRQKLAGVARRNRKSSAATPAQTHRPRAALASGTGRSPPSLQRAAQVPPADASAFQKQDSPGAIGTQLQRPLLGGVPVLRGGNAMEFRRRRFLHLTAAAAAGLFASPLAWAQDYPARAVTIVVPFTPGGSTDIIARMLAQKLEQRLGKSFVVENRPGAGTIIAASAVAKAAPDGYLLLMAPSSTMAVNVTLYKKLPYDPPTDFIPLAGLARVPFVLLVNPSLPVHSLPELIAYAKARPGQLSFASVGPGVPHHLYAELLMSTAG